ncbi:hypothetical protein T4A_2997, partial [Trichinella pseudospiralis]
LIARRFVKVVKPILIGTNNRSSGSSDCRLPEMSRRFSALEAYSFLLILTKSVFFWFLVSQTVSALYTRITQVLNHANFLVQARSTRSSMFTQTMYSNECTTVPSFPYTATMATVAIAQTQQ